MALLRECLMQLRASRGEWDLVAFPVSEPPVPAVILPAEPDTSMAPGRLRDVGPTEVQPEGLRTVGRIGT